MTQILVSAGHHECQKVGCRRTATHFIEWDSEYEEWGGEIRASGEWKNFFCQEHFKERLDKKDYQEGYS